MRWSFSTIWPAAVPSSMTVFSITREAVERIYEQARAEAPREACGMLGGSGLNATIAYSTENSDTSNVTYNIDPQEAFSVVKQMRSDKVDFVACYHSHPETEAYPSPTDKSKAGDSELVYVIVSLRRPDEPELRAYLINDGQVVELDVRID